jgi:hypothetical protein
VITFSHMKLARRKLTEVKRFSDWARSQGPGEPFEFAFEHAPDHSCCRIEPLERTLAVLIGAARQAQPQEGGGRD